MTLKGRGLRRCHKRRLRVIAQAVVLLIALDSSGASAVTARALAGHVIGRNAISANPSFASPATTALPSSFSGVTNIGGDLDLQSWAAPLVYPAPAAEPVAVAAPHSGHLPASVGAAVAGALADFPPEGVQNMPAEVLAALASRIADGSGHVDAGDDFVPSSVQPAPERQLVDHQQIFSEVDLDSRVRRQVPGAFHSFKSYMESMLHHPRWGYYTSGRVKLGAGGDFSTFPIDMSPYFGQMLASQAVRMWEGMIAAGTLSKDEPFTVAEFGGGDGTLAHDFLDSVLEQARAGEATPWGQFARQLRYVSYERSPVLRQRQQEKNAVFGAMYRTEEADARDPSAYIPVGSLKGLVLSNELPDAFGVHKVVFSRAGKAEVAHVIAYADRPLLSSLEEAGAPSSLRQALEAVDRELRSRFGFHFPNFIYFNQAIFEEVMTFLSGLPDEQHRKLLERILFHETYVPASLIPALAEHLRRNARELAVGLGAADSGYVSYVNVDADRFIQGAGAILKAGYVITIDYGHHTWGLVSQSLQRLKHFRTYSKDKRGGVDPYETPSLRDMTADVDFSALARSGEDVGLKMVHFGPQGDLLASLPQFAAIKDMPGESKLKGSIDSFLSGRGSFRIMVQQKAGTDERYAFAGKPSEAVTIDARARQIRRQLLSPVD